MPQELFCKIDGRETGPHSARAIQQLAGSGQLKPEDLVRRSDSSKWVTASKVNGLVFNVAARGSADPVENQPTSQRQEILGVPASVARSHVVYPVAISNGKLRLLAAEPNPMLRDTLHFVLNCEIELIPAEVQKIRSLIDQNYASPAMSAPADDIASTPVDAASPAPASLDRVNTRLGVVDLLDLSSQQEQRDPPKGSVFGRIWRSIALSMYASKITAKVRDTNPSRASGLYDHEPYLQNLGRKIHARYGLQGMMDVFQIVEKRKGRGVTSELGRIWRTVEDWSY